MGVDEAHEPAVERVHGAVGRSARLVPSRLGWRRCLGATQRQRMPAFQRSALRVVDGERFEGLRDLIGRHGQTSTRLVEGASTRKTVGVGKGGVGRFDSGGVRILKKTQKKNTN